MIKRAIISVSDKSGLIEFAKVLTSLDIEIISTGGTSEHLRAANIAHRQVEEMTGLKSLIDGRVKTLHPTIAAGILGLRDKHAEEMAALQMPWIDLVVVNFYPFAEATKTNQTLSWQEVVQYIDIGGPTMVRAAAKNFAWVGVVVDPKDYPSVADTLQKNKTLSDDQRKLLASKAFAYTARYDSMIHAYFSQTKMLPSIDQQIELRYGENPHQSAVAYTLTDESCPILSARQHQGKQLSYNNILDAETALLCVSEFVSPACVFVKHANPCGVATATTIADAYQRAYEADPTSAFGGIVAINQPLTQDIAEKMATTFLEVVIAPSYEQEALKILAQKTNLRLLEVSLPIKNSSWEFKSITGGLLCQEKDSSVLLDDELTVVTEVKPSAEDITNMLFSWRVLKYIKSNAILLSKEQRTVGIGAGQVSRRDAVSIALQKAGENIHNTVLASDAYFPFRDNIDLIAGKGILAIIQPGGSKRDQEVIDACNQHKIAMVFTGKRCFRH